MDAEQAAQQAMSLRDNDVFQAAMARIRTEALEALANAPASDASAIMKHQATVKVVDNLLEAIEAAIRQGAPKKSPGIA